MLPDSSNAHFQFAGQWLRSGSKCKQRAADEAREHEVGAFVQITQKWRQKKISVLRGVKTSHLQINSWKRNPTYTGLTGTVSTTSSHSAETFYWYLIGGLAPLASTLHCNHHVLLFPCKTCYSLHWFEVNLETYLIKKSTMHSTIVMFLAVFSCYSTDASIFEQKVWRCWRHWCTPGSNNLSAPAAETYR